MSLNVPSYKTDLLDSELVSKPADEPAKPIETESPSFIRYVCRRTKQTTPAHKRFKLA